MTELGARSVPSLEKSDTCRPRTRDANLTSNLTFKSLDTDDEAMAWNTHT